MNTFGLNIKFPPRAVPEAAIPEAAVTVQIVPAAAVTAVEPKGVEAIRLPVEEKPQPKPSDVIRRFLDRRYAPGELIELRAPGVPRDTGGNVTFHGVYNDREAFIRDAGFLTQKTKVPAIYVNLQTIKTEKPWQEAVTNALKTGDSGCVAGSDIARYSRLLIDADTSRPVGFEKESSTDEEKTRAYEVILAVKAYMESLGLFGDLYDSGNGYHNAYTIDLPATEDSKLLLKAVLASLSARFSTESAHVDEGVYDLPRVVKLPGSFARKGKSTPERPHRWSGIISEAKELKPIPVDVLLKIAELQAPPKARVQIQAPSAEIEKSLEYLRGFLDWAGLEVLIEKPHEGGIILVLKSDCPREHKSGHHEGECHIGVNKEAKLAFACKHDSCAGIGWKQFRAEIEKQMGSSYNHGIVVREPDAKTEPAHELASPEINPADVLEGVDPDVAPEYARPFDFLNAAPAETARFILSREMRALGITVTDNEPEQPNDTEVALEMPQSALASTRLGDIYANLFEPNEFPLDWALPALVTAASTLVPPLVEPVSSTVIRGDDNMVNLYTALVSKFGAGKSSVIEWAAKSLNIWNAPLSPHYAEGKWGSAEQMFHYLHQNISKFRNNILINPDELAHLFAKAGIPNASFATILTTSYYRRRQTITIARNKELNLNHALSLIGGVVDNQFGTVFGSSTIGGLWDRFLFAEGPDPNFQWIHRDYPCPLSNTPLFTPVAVTSDGSITEVEKAWRKNVSGLGRIVEICIRIAKVYASMDGRALITGKDLEVLKGLAMRQKAIREVRQPNAGTNPDAMFANAVTGWLRAHTKTGWVSIGKLKDGIHSYRMQLGPGVAERCLQVMARQEDIEIWTPTGKDGKDQPLPDGYSGSRPRVGLVRLRGSGRVANPAKTATNTTS